MHVLTEKERTHTANGAPLNILSQATQRGPRLDGLSEARAAATQLASLGVPAGNVVYKDIENYNNLFEPYCSETAISFLKSWIEGIHAAGFSAGVYFSAANVNDILALNPQPDDVRIGQSNSKVSIWGLGNANAGYPISDSVWTTHQRTHQYAKNITETWGGVPFLIDHDIEDAPVVGGGGIKTFPGGFTEYNFDIPGDCEGSLPEPINNIPPCLTIATGINDPQPPSGGNVGQIVGYYYNWIYYWDFERLSGRPSLRRAVYNGVRFLQLRRLYWCWF